METSHYFTSIVIVLELLITDGTSTFAEGLLYDVQTGQRAGRMWVPDLLTTVRGIIIYGNGAGGDDRYHVDDQSLRGFARQFGFVIIATAFWTNLRGHEIEIWEDQLSTLGTMSGHPELVNAPWVALGFSNGGQMAYGFNYWRPEKVVGFVVNKGGYYLDPYPDDEALLTPAILVAGELDADFRRDNIRGLFETNRSRGARWSWLEEQAMGHEGTDERLFLPFLAECIRLRYPPDIAPTATTGVPLKFLEEESGWLIDNTTWNLPLALVAPYSSYPGDPLLASWVPNRACAFLYRAFATRTDWIEKSDPGYISDRPLYIEIPGFGDYWWNPPGIAPFRQTVHVDTSEYPCWIKAQFFANDNELVTIHSLNIPKDSATAVLELPSGIHGLSVLFTDQDGVIRTTGIRHRPILDPACLPSTIPVLTPSTFGVLIAVFTILITFRLHRGP